MASPKAWRTSLAFKGWREWSMLIAEIAGGYIGYTVAALLLAAFAVPGAAAIWWWIGVWGLR